MSEIKERIPVPKEPDQSLFDDDPDLEESSSLQLNDGLTAEDIGLARLIAPFSKGVIIVTGAPRSGKDMFGNWLAYQVRRLFRGKKVLRDEKPRRLFGAYIPFNEFILNQDIARMKEVADGKGSKTSKSAEMDRLADDWLKTKGEFLLQNAVLYLTEFGRYMYNREPFNPMNRLLGRILRMWGHLDLLVIGTTQMRKELDRFTCLPFVTSEVRCKWSLKNSDVGLYNIHPEKTVTSGGAVAMGGKVIPIRLNGRIPRKELGGKRLFDLWNSKSAPQITPTIKIEGD